MGKKLIFCGEKATNKQLEKIVNFVSDYAVKSMKNKISEQIKGFNIYEGDSFSIQYNFKFTSDDIREILEQSKNTNIVFYKRSLIKLH